MTLAARMQQAQTSLFVGRTAELARFEQLLAPSSDAGVLFVFGEMGAGKTWLLQRFAALAVTSARRCVAADVRVGKPRAAIESAGLALHAGVEATTRQVLLVDHFHGLAAEHKKWFLDEYLPTLPECTLVVLADRQEPSQAQLEAAALGWPFSQRMKLGPLDDHDGGRHLAQRRVGSAVREELLVLTRGVPLLLGIAAQLAVDSPSADGFGQRTLESAVCKHLAHELAPLLEANDRRVALAALAVAYGAVHDLLVWVHDAGANVDATYKWLGSLSFVDHTSRGLRIHTAARLAVLGLLHQHHPSLLERVSIRVRRFYDRQLDRSGSDYQRWFGERMHLSTYWRTKVAPLHIDDETCRIDRPNPLTTAAATELTARRDGAPAASWIDRWLGQGETTSEILTTSAGAFAGYSVSAHRTAPDWPKELEADPTVTIIDAFCQRECLVFSSDQSAFVVRSALIVDGRCEGRAVSTLLTSRLSLRLLRTPNVHFLFVVTRVPEVLFWISSSPDFAPILAGTHRDGAVEHLVYFYDLRPRRRIAEPPAEEPQAESRGAVAAGADSAEAKTTERSFGALLRARLGQLATAGGLTAREKEVLDLVVLDRNAEEIGKVLGISARTAKFHQARLLAKLGADSRMDLFRLLL